MLSVDWPHVANHYSHRNIRHVTLTDEVNLSL
jgi:hypothetical protein